MTHSTELLISNLLNDWALFEQSLSTLALSVEKCKKIVNKDRYSFEELESIDSLTSKFSRSTDIYTQKILRGLWALMREPYVPFIDMMNKAEKMGIVVSAESLLLVRELRNSIAHEYLPDALQEMAKEVIEMWDVLQDNIRTTALFVKQHT